MILISFAKLKCLLWLHLLWSGKTRQRQSRRRDPTKRNGIFAGLCDWWKQHCSHHSALGAPVRACVSVSRQLFISHLPVIRLPLYLQSALPAFQMPAIRWQERPTYHSSLCLTTSEIYFLPLNWGSTLYNWPGDWDSSLCFQMTWRKKAFCIKQENIPLCISKRFLRVFVGHYPNRYVHICVDMIHIWHTIITFSCAFFSPVNVP